MMRFPRLRTLLLSRPRLPRRTARLRLAVLYGGLFVLCGAVLLAVTYLLTRHATGGGAKAVAGWAAGAVVPINGVKAARPLPVNAGAGVVRQVAGRQIAFDLEQLLIQSGIALGIVAVAAAALGWLVAGRVLRPLATITATARRISASSLHERLAMPGPDDELKELGDTLDDLFTRLEASFEAQRRFVANASHELRTPVTRERTLLQVALTDPAATVGTWQAVSRELLASNAEQERLIEALLTLASSEGGLDRREPVDLAAVTREVLQAPRPGVDRIGLRVAAATEAAVLDGDALLVERLVANLVDNAVCHNVPGGRVEIGTGTRHGRAVLSVISTGPVIPPAEVDRLFQPFQRLGSRRVRRKDGHGLGLSIVRAIATAHGATIAAHAPPGGGLAIDVVFPPPADSPAVRDRRGHGRGRDVVGPAPAGAGAGPVIRA
jgi:signal transduction histidine kinase